MFFNRRSVIHERTQRFTSAPSTEVGRPGSPTSPGLLYFTGLLVVLITWHKGGRERLGVNVTNPSERGKHDQACQRFTSAPSDWQGVSQPNGIRLFQIVANANGQKRNTPFPNGDKRKRPKKAEKKLCHSIKIIPKYTKELVKHHPLDFIFIVEAQLAVAGSDAGKGRHRLRAAGRRRRRRRRRRAPPPSPAAAPTRLRGACSGGAAGAMEKIVPQTPLRNSWESRRRERCPQRPQPLGNIATRPYAPVDELGPN